MKMNGMINQQFGNLGRATKCAALENLSTILRITVLLLEGGSPVTKPTAIQDQGRPGMERGWRIGAAFLRGVLAGQGIWFGVPRAWAISYGEIETTKKKNTQ